MDAKSKPKKSLGQNFLSEPALLERIVLFAGVSPESRVLEIGPGRGALTQALLEAGAIVQAVEADSELVLFLERRFQGEERLKLYRGDILRTPLSALYSEGERYQVVANIPYYITAPIIKKLLTESPGPERITLLVQKEVAERLGGGAQDRSLLTVAAQFYSDVVLGPVIPKTFFEPVPKVDSQLITLVPTRKPLESDRQFFQVVRAGFAARRKTLFNNLLAAQFASKETLQKIFTELKWDTNRRAQELEVREWETVVQKLVKGNALGQKNNEP